MKKVRYFICKPKIVNNTRIPEIIEKFQYLPINWSAVYYPSLQEAEEVCVRIEYEEDFFNKIQQQLYWFNNNMSNELEELKKDEDWERVKDKFNKEMWKDADSLS